MSSDNSPVPEPKRQTRCHLDPHTRTKLVELKLVAGWSYPQIHREYPSIPISTIQSTVYLHQKRGHTNESVTGRGRKSLLSEEERERIFTSIRRDPKMKHDDLLAQIDFKITKRTLRRLLNKENLRKREQLQRNSLTEEHAA